MRTWKEYRPLLVKLAEATGEYIKNNADLIVDKADLKTDFSIKITYEQGSYPIITIMQEHAMAEVIDVLEKEV